MIMRIILNDGIIHTAPKQSDFVEKKDEELIKRINEDKKVCLECTKEKCYGGERCFLNMKNAKRTEK